MLHRDREALSELAGLIDALAREDHCSRRDEITNLLLDAALARCIEIVFEYAGRSAQVWARPLLASPR